MPVRSVPMRFFEIKVGLQSSLTIFAGATQQDAREGRFRTAPDAPRAIFEEILRKLADAIHVQDRTIPVNVESDRWIVQDTTFGLAALDAQIEQLRFAVDAAKLSLDTSLQPAVKGKRRSTTKSAATGSKKSNRQSSTKTSTEEGKSTRRSKKDGQ